MAHDAIRTQCCIAGGGPAGVMVGYLLARAGVSVMVLEKHTDFLRDFRGDTVHPSTMEALAELGLLEVFLQRPHSRMDQMSGRIGEATLRVGDLRHLPTRAKFVAIMPQWDFLDFLSGAGRALPKFDLRMSTEATDLIEDDGRIIGVRAKTAQGLLEIRAHLVIAADGRGSTLRQQAGLKVRDLGAPIDVLWFRLPRQADDPQASLLNLTAGAMMVMIDRTDYYQCGFVVPKGGFDRVRADGLDAFKREIEAIQPLMAGRMDGLRSWDDVRLLTVAVDRLEQWWRPGLVCIGDAAHAMSPIGGVGVNLAIQDAVATANLLAGPLAAGRLRDADLAAVQRRRLTPTRLIQALQVAIQNRVLVPALSSERPLAIPWPLKLLDRFALLRRLPARAIGMGFRMEHVRTPDARLRG